MAEKKTIAEMLAERKPAVKTFAEADEAKEKAEKKKGGRPKKEPSEKATENRIAIYLTPDELTIVKTAADSFGMSVGKYIKMSSLRSAKKDSN